MKLHNIVISILIVSLFVIASTTFLSEIGANYAKTTDFSGLDKTMAALRNQTALANQTMDKIKEFVPSDNSDSGDSGILLIPYKFFQTGWSITKLIFNSFVIVERVIEESFSSLGKYMDLPFIGDIQAVVISIFFILLVTMITYAFFKWKFET